MVGFKPIVLKNIMIVNTNKIGAFVFLAIEKNVVIMRGIGSVAQW